MRKVVFLVISALLTITLAACGGGSDTPANGQSVSTGNPQNAPVNDPTPAPLPVTDENIMPDDFSAIGDESLPPPVFFFKIGDTYVYLNENITDVIKLAGEPQGPFEMPSCAFDGMDRVFRYPGVDLYTYPVGDNDFVYNIAFFDDTVRTAEGGIRLGSSLQDVLDAYGDDYVLDSGMYTFTRGLTVLEFLVSDDTVIAITYRFLVEIA